jgi:hypothetical protein
MIERLLSGWYLFFPRLSRDGLAFLDQTPRDGTAKISGTEYFFLLIRIKDRAYL